MQRTLYLISPCRRTVHTSTQKPFRAPSLLVPDAVVAVSSITEHVIIIVKPCAGNNFFGDFALFGPSSARRHSGLERPHTSYNSQQQGPQHASSVKLRHDHGWLCAGHQVQSAPHMGPTRTDPQHIGPASPVTAPRLSRVHVCRLPRRSHIDIFPAISTVHSRSRRNRWA